MKHAKLALVSAVFAVALGLQTGTGWATQALGALITGEITASPSPTQIEIAHRVYHIKAHSPAAAAARSFYLGQVVDVTLDKPAINAQPEVVSVAPHAS
jgi:hypothetical protein